MKYYLEFEEPIRLLDEEIHLKESILEKSSELTKEIALLHEDRLKLINKIHSNLIDNLSTLLDIIILL